MNEERRVVPAIGRTIEVQENYIKHLEEKHRAGDDSCDLCGSVERQRQTDLYPQLGGRAIVLSNSDFTLIENDFPYAIYDGQEITAHHMLVPRAHIGYDAVMANTALRHSFADAEAEVLDLSDHAYGTGMARTSGSVASSIRAHAHKHFFVTGQPIVEQHFSIAEGRNDFRPSIEE